MTWRTAPNSWLWLHGIPGCGKTVLNAKVVRYLRERCAQHDEIVLHFYFDFRSHQNDVDFMLRSLILQLTEHSFETSRPIVQLHQTACKDGIRQPSIHQLLKTLRVVLAMFNKVYIVLDALDVVEHVEFLDLDAALQQMHRWSLPNAHFLITSRHVADVYMTLTNMEQMSIIEVLRQDVDNDIREWVDAQLSNQGRLGRKISRWHGPDMFKNKIRRRLLERASGMYDTSYSQLS